MAITFDISIIEEKIKKLSSKEERLNYLNRLLFDWDKVRIEFNTYDKAELKRLKDVTKDDYKAYKNEFDNGRLVYFDNGKFEKVIAERIGIKNLELLKKRLRLEFRKDDIKAKISILENLIKREQNKNTPPPAETKTDKLKVNQIALIHVYEGVQITRENAGEIAAKHGYTAKNSGEGLFQDYTNYCSTANRKGKPTPCTPKKLKNKIELFESVVSHLSDNNKQRAIDEINILKTIFENEYQ